MVTPQAFEDIAANFSLLEDWEDRYRYLVELGQALPPLEEGERNAANKVHGCASQVWLVSETDGSAMRFRGESDAMIVRGLVAVLIALYSGRPAAEIAETDAMPIFDRLGLGEHLTSQRANGLAAMVKRIRSKAAARVL
jgi:cysteine desulfuration protein SufE